MNKNDVRILVFTVPSWNSKIGANSWESLLCDYPSAHIANIYIRDEIPDSESCDNYFWISEHRVIKSIADRRIQTGEVVKRSNSQNHKTDMDFHNRVYNRKSKRRPFFLLLIRELLWKLGKWKTKELDLFLDEFSPDVILHSMDGYIHLNRIIEYSIKRTGARSIGYIWDDNFTYKQSSNVGFMFYRFLQRKSLHRLNELTDDYFAITDKTKKEADNEFGINCKLLTKPLNSSEYIKYHLSNENETIKILYTGNLLYGRINSLMAFVEELSKFSKNVFHLDVYTQTCLSEKQLAFLNCDVCTIHEPISQKEVLQLQKETDILLFLEGISGSESKVARLSFSTKITDYLSSSKPILAIGNSDIAPIEYFRDKDSAIVASTPEEIKSKLEYISINKSVLEQYSEKAYKCGFDNHNPTKIHALFDSVICE